MAAPGLGEGLEQYAHVLRRRWLTVVLVAMVILAVSVALLLKQATVYEASSEVLINRNNLAATLTQTQVPSIDAQTAARLLETQVQLAREPALAARVVQASGLHESAHTLLDSSSVASKNNADIVDFTVRNRSAGVARRVATIYGAEFTRYRQELDTRELQAVATSLGAQLAPIDTPEGHTTPLWSDLQDKLRQVQTLLAVQSPSAQLVRTAPKAARVEPRPLSTVGGGLLLGLLLGVGTAFLRESVDTRVRSSGEVGRELEVPLLGRVPAPPAEFIAEGRLVMLDGAELDDAEAFMFLRTGVEFALSRGDTHVLMVSSAIEGEGKTTTAANLAVAFARAGRRVILVDADLRRPAIAGLFGLDQDLSGLSELVRTGGLARDPLVQVPIPEITSTMSPLAEGPGHGSLNVLPGGYPTHSMNISAIERVLDDLRPLADLIVLDSPPLLQMGDAVALSAGVDALLLVARINVVRRPMLQELRRILDATPVQVLGFVLTGTAEEAGYGGYYRHSYAPRPPEPDTTTEDSAPHPTARELPRTADGERDVPAPAVTTTAENGQEPPPSLIEAGLGAVLEGLRRRRANRK